MPNDQPLYQVQDDGVTLISREALDLRQICLPLSGVTAGGIKSAITPRLAGDIKIDRDTYVTKPVSREDLRVPLRNFFVMVERKGVFSLTEDSSPRSAFVEIGALWQRLVRRHSPAGLEMEALNFVPVDDESVELMRVTVRNISRRPVRFTATAAVPLFARALANKHDHEHVTSLLHRTRQRPQGVVVAPAMIFNEEGHRETGRVYFVLGQSGAGERPQGTFPTVASFCGEAGTLARPQAVYENLIPSRLTPRELDGREAMGALRFRARTLKPGASAEFLILIGTSEDEKAAQKTLARLGRPGGWSRAFEKTQDHWRGVMTKIEFASADPGRDSWLRWVAVQPVLRRLWGCSFLPDHDYGKGGKGWRDLWQDLLALILVEPDQVRGNLINNFRGVRVDGSNATVIGTAPGEFLADRNAITRVWMDHGVWPWLTTQLYLDQTGDWGLLFEEAGYFRDAQWSRATQKDRAHDPRRTRLLDRAGGEHQGTVLEHLLLQNLVPFFNVGEHNLVRLENADWNDGLDMAAQRGESVAFSAMYAGNLRTLAGLLERLGTDPGPARGETFLLTGEMLVLLDTLTGRPLDYDDPEAKRQRLFKDYFPTVQPTVSGERAAVKFLDAARDLRAKADWLAEKIRAQEKVTVTDRGRTFRWFNGYYDNQGERVEGRQDGSVRMTLTGQVFPVLAGVAQPDDVRAIVASVNRFLKDRRLGGLHLNTDFGLRNYLDLGRAFSFAYGTKENGAFFNHMSVMMAYALYSAGFAAEGGEVLDGIEKMCRDSRRAKIYPGVPEYFDPQGRGMYPYLTGSASWLILTELTRVFGARGEGGDLVLDPKLRRKDFSAQGRAGVTFPFAGKKVTLHYHHPSRREAGDYKIKEVRLNGEVRELIPAGGGGVKIPRGLIAGQKHAVTLEVRLQ